MSNNTKVEKRFLDKEGLIYFARVLSNYPDNAILSAVIDAISTAIEDNSANDKEYADGKIADLIPKLIGTMEEEEIINPEFDAIAEIQKLNTTITELEGKVADLTARLDNITNG